MAAHRPSRVYRAEIDRKALETGHLNADLARHTARGGVIVVGAQVARMAVQFATMAILARLLLPADFGLIAMAAAFTGFAAMFTDLGLSTATVQSKEIDEETVSALFLISLAMGLGAMVAVMTAAPLAAWFYDDPRVFWIVMAFALPIPLVAAGRQQAAILQRGMRWLALEWTGLAAQLLGGTTAIYLAWQADWGYWALVAQSWVSAACTLILVWAVCPWRPSRVQHWHKARSLLRFGYHLTGFQFLNYFHRQFDDVLVGWRWGTVELGHYNRAYALLMLPLQLINTPVSSVAIPALSRLQTEPERWRNAYLEALAAVTLVSSGITAILVACAEPIVLIAFGPAWGDAGEIFLYLAISMFPAAVFNTLGWIYISLGQARRMLIWGLITTPILILSFLVGLPFGPVGVAQAYSAAVCLISVPAMWFAAAGSPVTLQRMLRIVVGPIACGVLCAVAGRMLAREAKDLDILLGGIVTATAVGACYLVFVLGMLLWDPAFRSMKERLFAYGVGKIFGAETHK